MVLNTILRLKYDTLAAWKTAEEYVPMKGEVCVIAVPQNQDVENLQETQPAILFKVGDGTGVVFKKEGSDKTELPWASGLAADIHAWAKESSLAVAKNGTGNVVASISWDATLNNGRGGIKYETAAVATAEGLDQIQKDLLALTNTINAMYTNAQIDDAIANALTEAKDHTDTKDSAMNTRVAAIEAKFGEGEDNIESQIEAAVNIEKERAMAAEKINAEAITAIKDGASIDSFAEVESALAGKQAAGDYATKDEAQGYANAKDEAIAAAQKKADDAYSLAETKTTLTEVNKAVTDAKAEIIGDAETYRTLGALEDALATANTNNAVTVAESSPEGYLKAYEIKQGGTTVGTINIPRDMVVESGTVVTFGADDELPAEVTTTGTYIVLTLANATSDKIYVPVDQLIEYVTSGSAENDDVFVSISADHKVTATLSGDVLTSLAKADLSISDTDAKAAIATAKQETIDAAAADAATKAGTAESNAKTYTDTEIGKVNAVVANKANDADLATIAKTGNVNDLVQTNGEVLILFGGNAAGWTE